MKPLLLFISIITTVLVAAQTTEVYSDAISDCSGATNILQPGNYTLQFPGKGGKVYDLSAYPSLSEITEKNSLWVSFKASYDGRLSIEADASTGPIAMIVFENESKDVCDDIFKGKAEIRRLILSKDNHVGLNLITAQNVLYPIDVTAGKHLMFCFLNSQKEKAKLELYLKFEPTDGELKDEGETKVVDLRKEDGDPALNILVRDIETGKPVVANMTITAGKSQTLYNGSDFFITVERTGKMHFKVDAEGYFWVDREEPVAQGSEDELVLWLEPLGEGKSLQIDEIEFVPGTSEFMPTAETKLRRLKDFLALNAAVRIEIQGHVHDTGENTLAGQKLSEARAKRVMMYLVSNGIDKSRMTAVGYGNTRPIYKEAKFAYEEQANRRVEIKVL